MLVGPGVSSAAGCELTPPPAPAKPTTSPAPAVPTGLELSAAATLLQQSSCAAHVRGWLAVSDSEQRLRGAGCQRTLRSMRTKLLPQPLLTLFARFDAPSPLSWCAVLFLQMTLTSLSSSLCSPPVVGLQARGNGGGRGGGSLLAGASVLEHASRPCPRDAQVLAGVPKAGCAHLLQALWLPVHDASV